MSRKPSSGPGPDGPDNAGALEDALDFDRYLPTVLAKLMSKLRRSGNTFFSEHFGLTLLEWRIISFIGTSGPSSSYTIWSEGELDKAAVSRAVRELRRRKLVSVSAVPGSSRRKTAISLTADGERLHAESTRATINRHALLIDGFSSAEFEFLLQQLGRIEANIPMMGSGEAAATPSD